MAAAPCVGERPRDLDGVVAVDAALVPVGGRDPHGHRPLGGPHRAHRVEDLQRVTQPVRPASRRTRRCAGWSAARGTTTAGSRARSAVRAGRTRPAPPPRAHATNCSRISASSAWSARAAPGSVRASTATATGRTPPSCPPAAARPCPPTSASSSPCGPECPSWIPILAGDCACTKSTTRRHAASCSAVYRPGAAGRDPALGGDAHHLGHHQPGAAERLAAQVHQVEVAGHAVLARVHVHRRDDDPVRPAPARPSRNGWNIGGALGSASPILLAAANQSVHARRRTPGRAAAGCRRSPGGCGSGC